MENTKIEWADHTFNPWIGCTKISAGCTNCYAEVMDKRTARGGIVHFGPKADRRITSDAYWAQPSRWDRAARKYGARKRVFCASMADAFDDHSSILPEWRDHLWWLIEGTSSLDWLLLTKRPENVRSMVPPPWLDGHWPENVWIGTSVEDQASADARILHLLGCPAPVKFLSMEPLLGPVTLPDTFLTLGRNGWVIVGGESGPKARPMHPDWARSIRDQCIAAGVPFLFKQWGEWAPQIGAVDGWTIDDDPEISRFDHLEWDEDRKAWGEPFRPMWCDFQDGNYDEEQVVSRIGKRRSGRLLDFVEWSQFPQDGV